MINKNMDLRKMNLLKTSLPFYKTSSKNYQNLNDPFNSLKRKIYFESKSKKHFSDFRHNSKQPKKTNNKILNREIYLHQKNQNTSCKNILPEKILQNTVLSFLNKNINIQSNEKVNFSSTNYKTNSKKTNFSNSIKPNTSPGNLFKGNTFYDLSNYLTVYNYGIENKKNISKPNSNPILIDNSKNNLINKNKFYSSKSFTLPKMENKFKKDINQLKFEIKTQYNQQKNPFLKTNKINNNKKIKLLSFDCLSIPGTEKGIQCINKDCYLILTNINDSRNVKIFGVFDGHGKYGDLICQEIRQYFTDFFNDNNIYIKYNNNSIINDKEEQIYITLTKNNYEKIFELFNNINENLHKKYKLSDTCINSGTTVNLLILITTNKLNKIISINLGNSKSILISNIKNNITKDLNNYHTPNIIEEQKRIIKNGGEVTRVDWADYGPFRIFKKGEIYPGLSISRSFGDFSCESLGLITVPDIKEYDIDLEKIKIIVMGTDGVWEFLNNEKIVDMIGSYYKNKDINGAVQKIVISSKKMWEIKNPNYIDDITAIVLFFK